MKKLFRFFVKLLESKSEMKLKSLGAVVRKEESDG